MLINLLSKCSLSKEYTKSQNKKTILNCIFPARPLNFSCGCTVQPHSVAFPNTTAFRCLPYYNCILLPFLTCSVARNGNTSSQLPLTPAVKKAERISGFQSNRLILSITQTAISQHFCQSITQSLANFQLNHLLDRINTRRMQNSFTSYLLAALNLLKFESTRTGQQHTSDLPAAEHSLLQYRALTLSPAACQTQKETVNFALVTNRNTETAACPFREWQSAEQRFIRTYQSGFVRWRSWLDILLF